LEADVIYSPGDEVYFRRYPGRWRVDTVSARGHPVLCTRLGPDLLPVTFRTRDGLWVVDQQRMSLWDISEFELCVVADMNEIMRVIAVERAWPGLKTKPWTRVEVMP
jgi:hypothetical protein